MYVFLPYFMCSCTSIPLFPPDQLQWLYSQWPEGSSGSGSRAFPKFVPCESQLLAQLHCNPQPRQVSKKKNKNTEKLKKEAS